MEARTFGFAIQWIGLDQQSYPNLVQERIDGAQDDSVNDVTNQGAKQLGPSTGRPIWQLTVEHREKRERTEEPEKDPKSQAPTHTRSIATHVALKQNPENRTDQECGRKR